MLIEVEHPRTETQRVESSPHPLCAMLRQLRVAARMSLAQVEERFGTPAVVVGAYERGDRIPPLPKLEYLLNCYGYRLVAVRTSQDAVRLPHDMVSELRAIANQLEATADAPRIAA